MVMMRFLQLALALALLATLGACSGNAATSSPTAGPVSSVAPVTGAVPTPSSASVGVVTGTLLDSSNAASQQPYQDVQIYLGRVLKSDQGQDGMVELSKSEAPAALTAPDGRFVFVDVPAGRYGLWMNTPRGDVLLNHPDTGADLVIEVSGGKVVELGTMIYPIPFS